MEVQGHPDDVSLLVRLWVEMSWAFSWGSVLSRQPPCEAVSWNTLNRRRRSLQVVSLLVRLWVEMSIMSLFMVFPMPSASLWGCELKCLQFFRSVMPCRSASLWGCELKYQHTERPEHRQSVSLLVRLWVEMLCGVSWLPSHQRSASLWGCELKSLLLKCCFLSRCCQPPCEAVSWNNNIINNFLPPTCVSLLVRLWVEIDWDSRKSPHIAVSLLVRLWVEIDPVSFQDLGTTSASLWGCELKCQYLGVSTPDARQPPCEAVSWNVRLLEHIPAS